MAWFISWLKRPRGFFWYWLCPEQKMSQLVEGQQNFFFISPLGQWHLWRPMSFNIHHQLYCWKWKQHESYAWGSFRLKAWLNRRQDKISALTFKATATSQRQKNYCGVKKASIIYKNALFPFKPVDGAPAFSSWNWAKKKINVKQVVELRDVTLIFRPRFRSIFMSLIRSDLSWDFSLSLVWRSVLCNIDCFF